MKIEILRDNNPEVANVLPGEVYTVFLATSPRLIEEDSNAPDPPPPPSDMEVVGTFKTLAKANEAADVKLKSLEARSIPDSSQERFDFDGRLGGHVSDSDSEVKAVQVSPRTVRPLLINSLRSLQFSA